MSAQTPAQSRDIFDTQLAVKTHCLQHMAGQFMSFISSQCCQLFSLCWAIFLACYAGVFSYGAAVLCVRLSYQCRWRWQALGSFLFIAESDQLYWLSMEGKSWINKGGGCAVLIDLSIDLYGYSTVILPGLLETPQMGPTMEKTWGQRSSVRMHMASLISPPNVKSPRSFTNIL